MPMSRHGISVADLEAVAADEHVSFRPGDILIVRSGFIKWYEENSTEDRVKCVTNGKAWVGVDGCEETLEWLWNRHFAAVAGDTIGFEAWPASEPYSGFRTSFRGCILTLGVLTVVRLLGLHDHLLALWGMPIGELWDLEALAAECERQGRWSFFLTSAPLNAEGGIASPPNAIAVF